MAIVVTGVTTFLVAPAMRVAMAPFTGLRRPEVRTEPYGAYVLSWSYATFLETVGAVLAIAFLRYRRLSTAPAAAFIQFILLILLLRGTLVMQLLFPWSMGGDVLRSMSSTGQFFLQNLVLTILAWLTWQKVETRGATRPCGVR